MLTSIKIGHIDLVVALMLKLYYLLTEATDLYSDTTT